MKKLIVYCMLGICFAIGFVAADDLEAGKRNQFFRSPAPIKKMLIQVNNIFYQHENTQAVRAELLFDLEDGPNPIRSPQPVIIVHTINQADPLYFMENKLYSVNIQKNKTNTSYRPAYKTFTLDDAPALVEFIDPDGSRINTLTPYEYSRNAHNDVRNAHNDVRNAPTDLLNAPRDVPVIHHNHARSSANFFPPFKLHHQPVRHHRVPMPVS